MKKIIMSVAAIAVATGLFAAEASVTLNQSGSFVKGTLDFSDAKKDPTVDVLTLDDFGFKDGKDLFSLGVSGDKAGASISVGTANGSQRDDLNIRSISVWMKPIDMIKISIGNVSGQTYCERLDWWKASDAKNAYGLASYSWSSYASVDGIGMNVNIYPMQGLEFGIGITPGANEAFYKSSDKKNYAAWGAYGKYQIMDNISAAVAWRDAGKDKEKILSIGADFGSGTPYYAFLNVRMLFEQPAAKVIGLNKYSWNAGITGIAFDNYVKYNFGFMTLEGRLPVVVRGLMIQKIGDDIFAVGGKETKGEDVVNVDPSYFRFGIRATVPVDAFNIYCYIHNDNGAMVFNSKLKDNMALTIQPGVKFSIGACALDLSITAEFSKGFQGLDWSVPFKVQVNF